MKNRKINIKKSTLTTLITIAGIIIAYIIMNTLSNGGFLSYKMQGLLVPICAYAILAVSLNLVVGLLGRAESRNMQDFCMSELIPEQYLPTLPLI